MRRILRPLVQMSNVQPTPQYVTVVLVFLMRASRMLAFTSEMAKIGAKLGSTRLVTSIICWRVRSPTPVRKPASPSMEFSISALHGQTVTQWPHETHDDSLIGTSASQMTRGRSRSQAIESTSLTWRFWQASTQRPQRMH